jgi:hypothetical protein
MTKNVWIKRALLVLLMGIVSIVAVNFVGDTTIYSLKAAKALSPCVRWPKMLWRRGWTPDRTYQELTRLRRPP